MTAYRINLIFTREIKIEKLFGFNTGLVHSRDFVSKSGGRLSAGHFMTADIFAVIGSEIPENEGGERGTYPQENKSAMNSFE
jgi:hypothetical protein